MAPRRPTEHEFRLARLAREHYGLADLTLEPELSTARTIAARLAAGRISGADPAGAADAAATEAGVATDATAAAHRPVTAGELHAAGILVSILGRLIDRYGETAESGLAAGQLAEVVGPDSLSATVAAFPVEFPRHLDAPEPADPEVALAQLLLLGVLSENPAVEPFGELIDLAPLRQRAAAAPRVEEALEEALEGRPAFPNDPRSLLELLREPAQAAPGSLADQLRYIKLAWGERFAPLLGDLLDQLLIALDVLAEEHHSAELAWLATRPDAGMGGPSEVYTFEGEGLEAERFSADTEWMPRLILVAKSTYVWLDQLSRQYGREIRTLDAIPDDELATLARRGITGLWLIGLWQRSRASARIKQLRGQPDAVASAYSLDDYQIAADLGGPGALDDLRARAGRFGIRLASDMVPNHMGIDSRWVIEHPDWFLALAESPFPAYSFNGPDLSDDERVGIRIEDHYYDATDAAVVFQRSDRVTGAVRYVYHGNDGTTFPWNDTAQLDYSQAEIREQVIRTIVGVARQFPVIRFDAAMVLAKRHIERLWFPEPGAGGAIPSRAGRGMSRRAFEALMPNEFWREVVDRVADEAPGTLLLAEAFWLLEGYFVRTLGMHRVYNSAFMNMLRDEQNAEYRQVMKNTVEFDPAILGRFVNFMSNPDEKTAVEQFGTGDKYFGVAALLATLPGLPMLGHGQVEGFHEQYGMEFRRARLDESVDAGLLAHHERTIFPLLHRRAEFAGSESFRLYDFETAPGTVNEDVFAYSNRGPDGERSLVLFHNRYAQASGTIRLSASFAERGPDGEKRPARTAIGAGLGLTPGPGRWLTMRNAMTGLEELRSIEAIVSDGFSAELAAYACRVYVDLHEVVDGPGQPWTRLAEQLAGAAVPSLDAALADLILAPEHEAVRTALSAALADAERPAAQIVAAAGAIRGLDVAQLRLWPVIRAALDGAGWPAEDVDRAVGLVVALAAGEPGRIALDRAAVRSWFADGPIRQGLRLNTWDGSEFVEREAWLLWLAVVAEAGAQASSAQPSAQPSATQVRRLSQLAEAAGYRVDRLLDALATTPRPGPGRAGATGRASRGPSSPRDGGAG
ncbi:MAG TPA: alpha-amylase family glycosyl hydrolase [Candidatus Limnocylindrales bacterium]|nr:alpha-amylase family glycosyl hydrolase [Candidatus Limnocylindrales bacterium]